MSEAERFFEEFPVRMRRVARGFVELAPAFEIGLDLVRQALNEARRAHLRDQLLDSLGADVVDHNLGL